VSAEAGFEPVQRPAIAKHSQTPRGRKIPVDFWRSNASTCHSTTSSFEAATTVRRGHTSVSVWVLQEVGSRFSNLHQPSTLRVYMAATGCVVVQQATRTPSQASVRSGRPLVGTPGLGAYSEYYPLLHEETDVSTDADQLADAIARSTDKAWLPGSLRSGRGSRLYRSCSGRQCLVSRERGRGA
jgi:hypothetical protein